MTRPSRVLILDPSGPEAGEIVRAAHITGHEVHAAVHVTSHAGDVAAVRDRVSSDFGCHAQTVHDLVAYARRTGIDAAVTTNEYLTSILADLCSALDLPGNDPCRAPAARDKAAMHQAFLNGGVTTLATVVMDAAEELLPALAAGCLSLPCVVKPATGAGFCGVTVVRHEDDLIPAWHEARAARAMYARPVLPRVLLQEHVDGAEYSVESLTQGGITAHLCATRKTVTGGTHRVEVAHSLPVALPAGVERDLYHQVDRAITAVGIRNGASHTEANPGPTTEWISLAITPSWPKNTDHDGRG